jgi:hypothetical protein
VNSSKDIQLVFMKSHRMPVSNGRKLAIIWQSFELIVSETKRPKIIEPLIVIFPSENINIAVI